MLLFIISGLFLLVYIALQRTGLLSVLFSGLGNLFCYLAVFIFIVSTFIKTVLNSYSKN
ncbi:MAG: hypothetical protein ACJASL_000694 [Paraglaciecola sp.]|jgi:hypothetical protein